MTQDAINDWSDGATGSISFGGVTTNYTIENPGAFGTDGLLRLDDGEFVTVTFDDPLPGLFIVVADHDANLNEEATFVVNGVPLNLEQAIIDGDIVLTRADGTPLPNNGLDVVTGNVLDGASGAENENFLIRFNVPITSLQLNYLDGGSGLLGFDALVCFARDAMIETEGGARAVQDLRVGDRIMTLDNGLQPIRWIGRKKLGQTALRKAPKLRPICIKAGSLGDGSPNQDLRVSPQHRLLARSKIAQRMFGTQEVLIPAKKLLPLDGVSVDETVTEVEYFHILLDQHEVIFANGAAAESLLTGAQALKSLSAEAREEIAALLPDTTPDLARPVPCKGRQMRKFAQRHQANHHPLCQSAESPAP